MTTTNTTTRTRNFATLAEFVASKVECADLGKEFGADFDAKPQPGYVYADCCYIERDTSRADYFLCVERSTWEGPNLESLESILWAEHYLFDTADVELSDDDGTLSDFVRAICESHRKPCDGDLWGVVFSEAGRTWSPSEARAEMIKHLFPAQHAGASIANVRVAAKANGPMIPMATLGRAHIESGVGVQSGGVGVQSAALALTDAELTNLITACKTSSMRTGSTDWQGMLDAIAAKLYAARDALDAKAVK